MIKKTKLQPQKNPNKLMVIATITTSAQNWQFIQDFRKKYDPKAYGFIEPHFTLFNSNIYFSKSNYSRIIRNHIIKKTKISFCIRTALMMPPLNNHKFWYIFLIPDEGFSDLVKLHRQIHQDKTYELLADNLPFIPHITIGAFSNKIDCLQVINQLHMLDLNLVGHVEKLQLIDILDNKSHIFDEICLE